MESPRRIGFYSRWLIPCAHGRPLFARIVRRKFGDRNRCHKMFLVTFSLEQEILWWGETVRVVETVSSPAATAARSLDRAHSYVSRIEKGDPRLDVPEFIQWCESLGTGPVDVIRRIVRR
jgi:hypothetical protein